MKRLCILLWVIATVLMIKPGTVQAAPTAPSNAQLRYLPSQLHLTWQDNSSDEYYFTVQRKVTPFPGTWQDVATVAANHTSYQMDNPIYNYTYSFRVKACGEYGCSTWSNEDSITIGFLLYSLKINSPNGGEILPAGSVYPIAWSNNYSPPAQVNLDYSLDGGTTWQAIKSNYPNTGLYYWKIPNHITSEGLVRVRSSVNSSIYDLSNHVLTTKGYDFDRGVGAHGWTVSAVYDEDGYPISTDFSFNWRDPVDYPQKPGSDPVGNGEGTMAIVKYSTSMIQSNYQNPNAEYWYQELISPDLTGQDCWQHTLGFKVRIAQCMDTNAEMYCNLIAYIYDTDSHTYRTFTYPASASPLTYCEYGVDNTWNYRGFLWSNVPTFPDNFILKRIYVRIWGDLGYTYHSGNDGTVFIDDIMPIWPFWDFNADGMTNTVDFSALSSAWKTDNGDATWNPVFDHNPVNYQIDIYDLTDFFDNWLIEW